MRCDRNDPADPDTRAGVPISPEKLAGSTMLAFKADAVEDASEGYLPSLLGVVLQTA